MIKGMIVAVDVGGTKTLVAGFDTAARKPEIQFDVQFPTPQDFGDFKLKLTDTLHQYAQTIDVLVFAMPGIVHQDSVIRFAHLDWGNVSVVDDFQNLAGSVIINNDATLGAIGEAHDGAHEFSRVLYVTLSTGVGTGFIVDKDIKTLVPSEGGHMMIHHDGALVPWEQIAAGSALKKTYGQYAKDMTDPEQWKQYAYDVAIGLVQLSAVLLPDVIVLSGPVGSQLSKYKTFLVDHMESMSSWYVPVPKVIQAEFPDNAVIRGCFYAAKQA